MPVEDEAVDLVDRNVEVIGQSSLDDCYSKGLLHRAITVFSWNNHSQLLLQRRSLIDDWFPGYWTASCTGHVKQGEDWLQASKREIREELGLKDLVLSLLFKYVVPPIRYGDLIEHELMYVVETHTGDLMPTIDKTEVEEVRFLTVEECKDFFETKQARITPDAIESFRRYSTLKCF